MILKFTLGNQLHILKVEKNNTLVKVKQFIGKAFKTLSNKYILTYIDEQGDEIILCNQNDFKNLLELQLNSVKVNIEEAFNNQFFKTQQILIQDEDSQSNSNHFEELKNQKHSSEDKNLSSVETNSNIDSVVDEHIKNMMPFLIEQVKAELRNQKANQLSKGLKAKPIHYKVTCDGCGMSPIVGVRYKCSIRENFDLCEKCQATTKDQYLYLKIKSPEQAPYKIFCQFNKRQQEFYQK